MEGDQDKTQSNAEGQTPNIDSKLLDAFDTTQEIVEQTSKEAEKRRLYLENIKNKAKADYKETRTKIGLTGTLSVDLGYLVLKIETENHSNIIPKLHEIPDLIANRWNKTRQREDMDFNSDRIKEMDEGVNTYIETWGQTAIEEGDWRTFIAAVDIVNKDQGGIIESPEALEKLKGIGQKDPTIQAEIVLACQERIDRIKKANPERIPPEFRADDTRQGAITKTPTDLRPAPLREQPIPTPRPKG